MKNTGKKTTEKKEQTTKEKMKKMDSSVKGTFLAAFIFAAVIASVGIIQMFGFSYAAEQPVESLPEKLTSRVDGASLGERSEFISGISLVKRFYGVDDGGKDYDIYCLERWLVQNAGQTYNKAQTAMADKGMAYLLTKIYPNDDNFLSGYSIDEKRYISQLTIWYYQDRKAGYSDDLDICGKTDADGIDPLTCQKKDKQDAEDETTYYWSNSLRASEKAAIKASSKYWPTINKIVTDALNYQENTNYQIAINKDAIAYRLVDDDKYLESSLIEVQAVGTDFMGYQFQTENSDVTFYNEQGAVIQKGTTIQPGQKFKFRVPTDTVRKEGKLSLSIQVTGTFKKRDAYMYIPDDHEFQKALIGVMQYNPSLANFNLEIDNPMGSVKIRKTDATTGEELPGATLVVTDQYGKEIDRWVSTDEPHYIDPIKEGKYTLTETIAPEGYQMQTSSIEFSVTKGLTTEVEMQNVPEIDVPDTSIDIPISIYIVGAIVFIIGVGLIVISVKKPRHE